MSSYQQLYLGAVGAQDSTPDYLTCGHCAREFLLANITLFIAHKAVGCDGSASQLSTESMQDTSSPLTCSLCTRVFLTARGLLQHAEQDHAMHLCLKKGPLLIPENTVQPPPAHTSLNRYEYDVTEVLNRTACGGDNKENDEPTDLSMSCSNKMGKAIIKCSDDECKITIKPNYEKENENPSIALPTSSLPKKRKLVYEQSGQLNELQSFREAHNTWPSFELVDDVDGIRDEASITGDTCMNFKDGVERQPLHIKPDPEIKMLVRAQYENERLCCVSVSTEKNKGNGVDELGEAEHPSTADAHLINSACDKACCPESSESCSPNSGVSQTTQLIYKLPKQVPRSPESAKPIFVKGSPEEMGWNASCMTQMVSTLSPTAATASTTITQPEIVYSPSSSMAFSGVLPTSSSVSSSSHYPTRASNSGPPTLISWSETLPQYPEERSGQCMPNSVSDVVAEEFQILRVKPPPLAASAPPIQQRSNQNKGHSLMSQSPRLLTPQSNMNLLHSGFDFDMSPMSRRSSDELAQAGNLDVQAFDITNGVGLSPAHDITSNIAVGNDANHMLSINTDSSSRSTSLDALEEGEVRKFVPLNRSPISHDERPDSQESAKCIPDADDQTSHDSQKLKKRCYPTSKPFQCSQCDQAFNQRIHLKKHMSKHTGVKPFKCIQCDYSTVERSHLKVHYRVHTGEKPFKCPFCDYATAQNSTLKIHLKRHHHGLQNPKRSKLGIKNSSSGNHTQDMPLDTTQDPSPSRRSNGPAQAKPNDGRERILSANFNVAPDEVASKQSSLENVRSSNPGHYPEVSTSSITFQPLAIKPPEHEGLDSHLNTSQNYANGFTERTEPECGTATVTSHLATSALPSSFGSKAGKPPMGPSQVKQITASLVDYRQNSLPSLQSSTPEDCISNSAQKAALLVNLSETWISQGMPSR